MNGYSVFASGTDENGNAVENYCLGKGDIEILEADGTITPGEDTHYLHLLDAQPTNPKEGDVYKASNGEYKVYQNNTWNSLGTILTEEQISAIDSVVDERATVIKFEDNTVSSYNWVGELSWETIANEPTIGWDSTYLTWNKMPTSVKIGTSISSIGQMAFNDCGTLSNVIIPNSVISIGRSAFSSCGLLRQISIPQSITSIDDWAFTWTSINEIVIPSNITNIGENVFSDCFSLTRIIVKGKTQAEAETLLANASVPAGCEITTWNDASQEWVADNYATNTYANSISALAQSASDKAN